MNKKFVNFFILRPVFTTVIYIILLIIGMVGYYSLNVESEPQVEESRHVIDCSFSSSLEGTEYSVAIPMEKAMLNISGIEQVYNTINNGGCVVDVLFSSKSSTLENLLNINNVIQEARKDMPSGCRIRISDSYSPYIFCLSLSSKSKSPEEIAYYIEKLKYIFDSINGVSSVRLSHDGSGSSGDNTVTLRPYDMLLYNVSFDNISHTLESIGHRGSSCDVAVGNTIVSVDVGYDDLSYNVDGLKNFPVINDKGSVIRLCEVANVSKDKDKGAISRYNDTENVKLEIMKKKEANLIEVCKNIRQAVVIFERFCNGNDIDVEVFEDSSVFVEDGISSVYKSIFEACTLVIIVIFLFLRSLRLSLIPAVAIPCSIIPTFMIMHALDISINIFSLFGIVLAVGLVVDDAIIVVENVYHYMEKGYSKRESVVNATSNIMASIISMTITLAVVFMPIFLISDQTMKPFFDFSISLTSSVLISGIVSLTLTPMLFDFFYNKDRIEKVVNSSKKFSIAKRLEHKYIQSLGYIIKHRYTLSLFMFIFLIYTFIAIVKNVKIEEDIVVDRGSAIISINGKKDNDMDISYVDTKLQELSYLIKNTSEYNDIVGFQYTLSKQNKASEYIALKLKKHKYRKYTTKDVITKLLKIHEGMSSDVKLLEGRQGGSAFKVASVNLKVYDDSYDTINKFISIVLKSKDISDIIQNMTYTDIGTRNTYDITVKPDICAQYNVSPATIYKALGNMHSARYSHTPAGKQMNRIFMNIHAVEGYDKIYEILNLTVTVHIKDEYGRMTRAQMPIKHFVTIKTSKKHKRKIRINGLNGTTLNFILKEGVSIKQVSNYIDKFNEDYKGVASLSLSPLEMRKIKAFNDVSWIMLLAILLIYLILSALFESFVVPLCILPVVPLSSIGSILLLFYLNININKVVIIGLITLIGLITKHGIMLVDYIQNNISRDQIDIIVIEAALTRLRPILMTTLCMVIGAIPLIMDHNEFNEYKIPIAAVIIGGMMFGTLITLYIVPCLYIILYELSSDQFIFRKHYDDILDKIIGKNKYSKENKQNTDNKNIDNNTLPKDNKDKDNKDKDNKDKDNK